MADFYYTLIMKDKNVDITTSEAESNRRIKAGIIMSYTTIFVNILSGLLYTPWMLKQIGDGSYGLYTLASSFIAMFIMDFGMSAAVSRFVTRYRELNDQKRINEILGIVYKMYAVISIVISIILITIFFFINRIYTNLSPDDLQKFKVVYCITALSTVFCFPFVTLNGILRSYEYFFQLRLCDLLNKIFTMIITIIALILNGGLYILVTINMSMNIVFVFVKLLFVKSKIPLKVNWKAKDRNLIKDIFRFSIWSTVYTISKQLTINIMPSIITACAHAIDVAHFSLARVIEGFVWTISDAINGVFLPKVTRKIINKDTAEDILPLMIKVGRVILSITAMIVIGIILVGNDFIKVWLSSDKYKDVYYMMIILTINSVISPPRQIAYTSLLALNKVKIQSIISISTAILNIIIAPISIKIFGVIGAAVSICLTEIIRCIIFDIVFYKLLKINVLKFIKDCYFKLIPAFSLIMVVTYFIIKYILIPNAWVNLIVKGSIYCIVYITAMLIIGWNKEEKKMIFSLIPIHKRIK